MPTPDSSSDWRDTETEHIAHADVPTRDHLSRCSRGQHHPVWDFIFKYYLVRPGQPHRWSPGTDVELPGATVRDISHLKFFALDVDGVTDSSVSKEPTDTASGTARMDASAYVDRRGKTVTYIGSLLRSTRVSPAHFDCFGLHEWVMMYHQPGHCHPEFLRLSQAGTDEVVKIHTARYTHFDAFRFFIPGAMPLSGSASTRETQPYCEQVGRLHANMSLYKWVTGLGEAIPGDLWADTFELACNTRELGMRAAPYDLWDQGFMPVRIKAPKGGAEYVHRQRKPNARADVLHRRLLEVVDVALSTQ